MREDGWHDERREEVGETAGNARTNLYLDGARGQVERRLGYQQRLRNAPVSLGFNGMDSCKEAFTYGEVAGPQRLSCVPRSYPTTELSVGCSEGKPVQEHNIQGKLNVSDSLISL